MGQNGIENKKELGICKFVLSTTDWLGGRPFAMVKILRRPVMPKSEV
jgi:hypothetical protein